MNKHLVSAALLFVFSSQAKEEWTDVTYLQRRDAKMRITVYDPPIIMDWCQIPEDVPYDLSRKMQTMIAQSYFMHDSFESWVESWKEYSTEDYMGAADEEQQKDIFDEQYMPLEEMKRKHPTARFESILYSVDFIVDGETYSMVVETIGGTPLVRFPDDMKKLNQSQGVGAQYFKLEDGIWKIHSSATKPFAAMRYFGDLERLKAIMEAGYAYHSIDHAGIWPFEPSDALKHDSVRDRRPGETVFRYPVKKPNVPPPDVPSAVESAGPRSETEEVQPAPGGSAPPRWVWLLAAYAVLATIFAVRGRKR